MSQEDRAMSLGGSQREDTFVFVDQRSCGCINLSNDNNEFSSSSPEREERSEAAQSSNDIFVVKMENSNSKNRSEIEIALDSSQTMDNSRTMSGLRFTNPDLQGESNEMDHLGQGCDKVEAPSSKNYRNLETKSDDELSAETDFIVSSSSEIEQNKLPRQQENLEQRLRGSGCQISGIRGDEKDFSKESSRSEERETMDRRRIASSPGRNNEEKLPTTDSSSSFTTSCSSNDPRIHPRHEANETAQNRSQQILGVHHQSLINNAINSNRSKNLRSVCDNNRSNNADLNNSEIDEIHRINSSTNDLAIVNYNSAFRNIHQEHILQPLQRTTNSPAKGNLDSIQVSAGNTMEKGKCQCHRIQQHQHQQSQLLSQIQQRDQTHHHRLQQHRHKSSQQRSEQQQQQRQQQNYRHHHYHHPHQHMGQQQDHQRSGNDRMTSRKEICGSGPDDESDETIETSLGNHQPPALPPRPPPRPNRLYEQNAISAYDLGPNNGEDTGCCKKYVVLCCLCGGLSAAVGGLFLAVHAVLSAHTASLALFETVPSYIPGTMLILMGIFTIFLARRKHRYGFLMKMCGSVGVVCALVCVLVTVTTTVVHMSRLQGLRECIYTERARSCTCYGSTQGRMLSDPGVLFEETPHCEAVHGALYDCLRALFGVSVAGILACIFSCMLLYQLLSHEKKKMYWEQLQLRCRSLYGQGGNGGVGGGTGGSCGCCNDCGGTSPWWAQTPGNLYTPNPDLAPFSRRWRLPWSRSRGPAPTPDSNYGFHTQSRGAIVMRSSGSSSAEPGDNTPGPYSVLTDESQTGLGGGTGAPYTACASSVASYSLLENGPGVPALWGPPPPYSDPNSPARRSQLTEDRRTQASLRTPVINSPNVTPLNISTNRISSVKRTMDNFEATTCEEYRQQRLTHMRPSDNYENTEELLSSSTDPEIEMGSLQQQQQQQQQPQQQQQQQQQPQQQQHNHHHHHHHHHHQNNHHHSQRQQDEDGSKGRRIKKALKGVENGGFQQEPGNNSLPKESESELYFGDVSSCCGPESSFYDLTLEKEQQQTSSIDPMDNPIAEYPMSNRPGKQRQSSKRSRLPLPLPSNLGSETSNILTENFSTLNGGSVVEDLSRSGSRGPYLAPDAQYEVIAQQARYTYYNPQNNEHVLEIPLSSLASLSYRNGNTSEQTDENELDQTNAIDYPNERRSLEYCGNEAKPATPIATSPSPSVRIISSTPSSPMPRVSDLVQRCNNESTGNPREALWQTEHQSRSTDGACPVNV